MSKTIRQPVTDETVVLQSRTRSGIVPVARTLDDLLEYYRLVTLSTAGRDDESGTELQKLISQHRIASAQKCTKALIIERGISPSYRPNAAANVPWGRILHIRLLDGDGKGFEVWTDAAYISASGSCDQ